MLKGDAMRLHIRMRLEVLGIFLSIIFVLNECKKLDGYKFPVYSTQFCPRNESDWNKRSLALNCNDTNGYTCLPNEKFTELLEFCYIRPWILIEEGYCLYLKREGSYVDSYSCHKFIYGCHNTSYQSIRIFENTACISIGNGCFLAEQSCKSSPNISHRPETTENDKTDWIWVVILIGTVVVLVCILSCVLYFTHKKRKFKKCKRGTDIEKNDDLEEGKPIITNTDNEKMDCSNIDPKNDEKKDSSYEGKPTASGGQCNTIRVKLNIPSTQDTLKYYFENTRKSGGGDIKSLKIIKGTETEVEDVLITFAKSKYAMNCLQQQHIIDKKTLNVQKYDQNDPSLWEMDKALVTGLNHVTTGDTLMNFLEPAAGVELIDLVRGAQEDTAIVVFAEKPDFAKLSKRCKEKTLEGKTLYVKMVEKCQTIYVKGIDKSITHDLVENFFCNKRKSGGGDVKKVDYHPEDGYCIIYFENPSDAINAAAKGKFTINDREIQAQMYFPCLGLPEQPMNWDDMPCVSYESSKYVIMFVKNCPKECSQIEEALQKKFVRVEWPESKSDFIVKLQCTVTKDVDNAKEILKSWKEEAEAEIDRHMKKYVCQKHSTVPEAWSAFLEQLKTLTIDQPDRVAFFLEKKKHTVIVAGYEENSEALTRTTLDLIKAEESKIQNQTEKIMKNIPLDFHKCQQLWKTHFGKKLGNDFPDLDFQVEINKNEVNLTGKLTEVNEALIKMHEYLMNTKSKSLNISRGRYEIFMVKEVKESFIAEMKAKGNKAVWIVTEDKVEMTSSNSKMADEALEIFKEFIPEKRIQMKDLVKVLTMHDWQACVKELRDKHDEKLNVSSSSSEVCVTATKDIFENVCKQIENVLKICSEKCRIDRKVVNLSQQQFSYIKYFGQNKIGQITNACTSKEFEIKQNQSDCSIEITGNDEDVKKAFENLMRFITHLREDSCSINKPGAKMFFNSSKGREAMKKAGKETSCIILNKEGLRQIKENRESGSFRGQRRTSYSLPIKIAECELHLCDKKFIVMKGDVTKLKVDVIVNAANGDLDHCGGLALAISRAGGKSIQEESKTYIQSNGTVPDGEAVPAHPGELPCKMLIHAVGPKWSGGSRDEERLLKKAIFRCLELTDKYKHSSIAIPALSAGIFGYPVAESVEIILSAIQSYIKTKKSSIREVYFCDVDDALVKEFVKYLKKNFGLEVKEFNGDEQDAAYGNDDDTSREDPQYQPYHSSNRGSRGCMQQPGEPKVTFLILSTSKENIRKAKMSLDEVYKCTDIDASKQN